MIKKNIADTESISSASPDRDPTTTNRPMTSQSTASQRTTSHVTGKPTKSKLTASKPTDVFPTQVATERLKVSQSRFISQWGMLVCGKTVDVHNDSRFDCMKDRSCYEGLWEDIYK